MDERDARAQIRIRLHSVDTEVERDGTFMVRVELRRPGGGSGIGVGRAHDLPIGRLRAGAEATLQAISRVASPSVEIDLRGVKVVRAFDEQVVIVSVRTRSDRGRTDLIGAVRAPDGDLSRGGTLAVLDALNRFLGKDDGSASEPKEAAPGNATSGRRREVGEKPDSDG